MKIIKIVKMLNILHRRNPLKTQIMDNNKYKIKRSIQYNYTDELKWENKIKSRHSQLV